MLRTFRGLALAALVLAAAPLLIPGAAHAQYREFRGKIDSINSKQMIVDNRMGDKLKFQRADGFSIEAEGEGEGGGAWDDLKKGQWVTVYWKMMDKPRKAYRARLEPEPEEEGEDE